MVLDPSIVSPTLTGVIIGGGVITNTVQDRGARCRSSVVPPLPDGDGGVTDRATRGACFLLNNKAVNQGSHLNLSQASAQRHRRYFLLNNKAVNTGVHQEPIHRGVLPGERVACDGGRDFRAQCALQHARRLLKGHRIHSHALLETRIWHS